MPQSVPLLFRHHLTSVLWLWFLFYLAGTLSAASVRSVELANLSKTMELLISTALSTFPPLPNPPGSTNPHSQSTVSLVHVSPDLGRGTGFQIPALIDGVTRFNSLLARSTIDTLHAAIVLYEARMGCPMTPLGREYRRKLVSVSRQMAVVAREIGDIDQFYCPAGSGCKFPRLSIREGFWGCS